MIVGKNLLERNILSGINKIYGTLSGGIIIQFNDNTYLEMDTVTNKLGIPRECMGAWGEHVLFKLVRFMNLRDLFHSFYVPYVKMRMEYDAETDAHVFYITREEDNDVEQYVVVRPLSEGGDVEIRSTLSIPKLAEFAAKQPENSDFFSYRLEYQYIRALAALTDNENIARVYRKYLQVDTVPPEKRFN
nr:MAG TPA: hypothetical protein [Caudoviricetes sp.]